jgi:threonine synthase
MYFQNGFPKEFEITPDPDLINAPVFVHPEDLEKVPAPGKPLQGAEFEQFVKRISEEIAEALDLKEV